MRRSMQIIGLWVSTAFRAAPGLTTLICVSMVLSSATAPLQVLGVKLLIDGLVARTSPTTGLVLLVACLAGGAVANAVRRPIGDTLDERINAHVQDDLVRLTTAIPSIAHHEDPQLADRISLLERDRHSLGGVWRLVGLFGAVTGAITVMALLWSVHPAMLALLVLALGIAVIEARGRHLQRLLIKRHEHLRRLGRSLLDSLTDPGPGIEVRCFGLSSTLLRVASAVMMLRHWRYRRVTVRYALWAALGWVVYLLGYAVALGWVLLRLRRGEATAGDVALILLIGPQVASTASFITFNVGQVMRGWDVFERYAWLQRYSAEQTRDAPVGDPPTRLRTGIELQGVGFGYTDPDGGRTQALTGVDVLLPAGGTVALVGDNGAGKSTLVKLLARLYDPTSGRILIDGQELSGIGQAAWRQRLSAGFQDFARLEFLASESIGVGDLEAIEDQERLAGAVAAGQAQPVIDDLPAGLATQLGRRFDGGVGLSGGQWQRLALARSFMRSGPLLMLLDEPTAALDPEAEHRIYDQYARIGREVAARTGGITVLVSHRFSTVRMADLILVLTDGRIVEQGSHASLLAADGRYASLFRLQASAYQ